MSVGHVLPIKLYVIILVALMILLVATVGVAFFDLGVLNIWVAMSIAFFKAVLVGLFFMHLKYSGRIVIIFAVAGVYWLAILLGLSMADYFSR